MPQTNYFLWFVAFASALGGFLFGYEIGIINTILSMDEFQIFFGTGKFNQNGQVVATEQRKDTDGNIVAIFTIGCVFGSAAVSYLADKIGRKRSIILGSALFAIGGAIQAAAYTIGFIYGGRVVSGLAIGILSSVVPLYISEVAPTEVRGRLISVQQLMITIGILISACINSVLYYKVDGDAKWRIALAIQVVPGIVLFFTMIFLPFSPRWLVDQEQDELAVSTLAKLRGESLHDPRTQEEFEDIKESIEVEKLVGQASWREMLKPGIRNRLIMALALQFFQQWTGINVIMYYSSQIYAAAGFPKDFSDTTLVIINNLINVLGTIPGMYFIERSGRRKLLIIGGFGMMVCHVLATIFVGMSANGDNAVAGYLALVAFYTFTVFFASSWGLTVWVFCAEIFPFRVRAKGTAASTMNNWIWNAVIGKIYPLLFASIKNYTYLIYAGFCLIMAFYAFTIPETKGKTLEEMDDIFYKNVPEADRPYVSPEVRERLRNRKNVVVAGGH